MADSGVKERSARYYANRLRPATLALRKPCQQCGVSLAESSGRRKYCVECAPDMAAYNRIRLYSLDRSMYEAMYFEQGGTCPLCGEREATHVDHCHDTGRVRALLCHPCNSALGHVERSGWPGRVAEYQGVHT